MKRLFVSSVSIFAAALLSACATGANDASPAGASSSLSAPTPAGVARVIKADSDGKTVDVAAGTRISVELVGVPTAGLMWIAVETPSFLQAAGEYGGPTSSAQLQEGFAGGNHWEAFLYDVTAAGEGALRFEQRSAFGGDEGEPPSATFSVNLKSAATK